tara:strand:+ start:1303 stop:1581 length:279 start_codon:yes stop_codon:yes gene_type:complete
MRHNKQEISLGLIIWDTVYDKIDKECSEFDDSSDLKKEKIVGDIVNEIALTLHEKLQDELADAIKNLKQEEYWEEYQLSEEEKRFTYLEGQQ